MTYKISIARDRTFFFAYISIIIGMYFHQHSSSAATMRYLGQQRTKYSLDLSFYAKNTTKHWNDELNTFILYKIFFFNIVRNGFRRQKNIYFHTKHEIFENFQLCSLPPQGSILKIGSKWDEKCTQRYGKKKQWQVSEFWRVLKGRKFPMWGHGATIIFIRLMC